MDVSDEKSIKKAAEQGLIIKVWSRARSLLARLEVLHLNGNGISNAGMLSFAEAMRKIDQLEMRRLWLGDNEVGDLGMHALMSAIEAGAMPKLEDLLIHSNLFGDSCMIQFGDLSTAGHIGQLRTLCVQNQKLVTRKGQRAVEHALALAASPRGKGSPQLKVFA